MARPLELPPYFAKEDFRRLYKEHGQRKYGVRLLALYYLQCGKSLAETAQLVCKTPFTVRDWVCLFEEGGLHKLLSIRPGRGRNCKLSSQQETLLKKEIEEASQSLKGGRLRGEDINHLIEKRFGVSYGPSGVYALLHRLGYSWITSRSMHPKADPEAQEVFKKGVRQKG